MAAAGAGDAPRADLPLLGDELAQHRDVLVVRLLDLVLAERARLPAASAGSASLLTPSGRLPAATCLRQSLGPSRLESVRARLGWRCATVDEDSRLGVPGGGCCAQRGVWVAGCAWSGVTEGE